MYIRFVIAQKDPDSGRRQGLFHALRELKDRGELYDYELHHANTILTWFDIHLDKPDSLTRSSKPHALNKAISWFKDSAVQHIQRMRSLQQILEAHGIRVEIIRTDRPGYIVYEDAYQIAAEPFQDTGA